MAAAPKAIIITAVPGSRVGGMAGNKIAIRRTPAPSPQGGGTIRVMRNNVKAALTPSRVLNRAPALLQRQPSPQHHQLFSLKRTLEVKEEEPEFTPSPFPHPPPRKRERLTNLSAEEKTNRRKMKNRIAAQTARDRKKERMSELEEGLETLSAQNEALMEENERLRAEAGETGALREEVRALAARCAELEARVGSTESAAAALGSAASISAPLQQEQTAAATRWALIWTVLTMLLSKPSYRTSSKTQTTSPPPRITQAAIQNLENIPGSRLSSAHIKALLAGWEAREEAESRRVPP